ncbi:MAG: hemerythrin family protein [Deferribacterota bacterium]|nr:hemerythrin family protein [Deferribacterota bacterium]
MIIAKDNYINVINEQKSKLIGIFLDLYNLIEQKTIKVDIKKILNDLYDYARGSFPLEEKLLYHFNYPNKYKHISEHCWFINKINEFIELAGKDNYEVLIVDIFNFLAFWIENHIEKSDYLFFKNLYNLKNKAYLNKN